MYGRYGSDKLNTTLIIAAFVVSFASIFVPYTVPTVRWILTMVSTLLIVLAVLRMFSKNFAARGRELAAYMKLTRGLRAWWAKVRGKSVYVAQERKNYKHLTCPQCMQKLRVPRGKGKIKVTCTKCGHKFIAKS